MDSPAAKTIGKDLESPKKHFQADETDGREIKKHVLKLGKETVAIGGRSEGKDADRIKALGEALNHVADRTADE